MFFLTHENDLHFHNVCILYFYTKNFIFHRKFCLMIDCAEKKFKNIKFIAIDAAFFKNLCLRFAVKTIPTIIFFKKKEIKRISGIILTQPFIDICLTIGDSNGKEN